MCRSAASIVAKSAIPDTPSPMGSTPKQTCLDWAANISCLNQFLPEKEMHEQIRTALPTLPLKDTSIKDVYINDYK